MKEGRKKNRTNTNKQAKQIFKKQNKQKNKNKNKKRILS